MGLIVGIKFTDPRSYGQVAMQPSIILACSLDRRLLRTSVQRLLCKCSSVEYIALHISLSQFHRKVWRRRYGKITVHPACSLLGGFHTRAESELSQGWLLELTSA